MVSFVDIGLLVFFAALSGLLAVRFKIPPVLALLTTGAVIGPHALRLISENDIVALFAEIGAVLLLFTIGAEFSLSKLKQFGAKAFSIGLFKLAIVFFLAFQLAQVLGLDRISALYMAAILAITSTALTIKILEQQGLAHRREVPMLVAALVIEDIFAIFALAYFSAAQKADLSTLGLATSILAAMAALGIAYFVVLNGLNRMLSWLTDRRTEETMLFLGFALAIGFSFLAQAVGLSTSVGAFLAGSLVASLPKGKALEDALSPFTLALSSIFFLAIGLAVDWNTIAQNGLLLVAFVAAGIVFKLVGTGVSTYLNGFDSKSAAFAAVAMVPTGEFSLVIANEAAKAGSPYDLIGLTSTLVFGSTVFASLYVQRSHEIHAFSTKVVPLKMQHSARQSAAQMEAIFRALSHMPAAMRQHVERAKANVGGAALCLGTAVMALVLVGRREWQFGSLAIPVSAVVVVSASLLLAPSLRRVAAETRTVLDYVRQAVRQQADAGRWLGLIALALAALLIPFVLAVFGNAHSWLNVVSIIVALALLAYALKKRDPRQSLPLPRVEFWRRQGL
ncbi:cation:proton antiporter [Candidatus Micrarchaeota archaeon]|nr:cation:proton antiporter [Candidatus Micrarchaeota archaeon]